MIKSVAGVTSCIPLPKMKDGEAHDHICLLTASSSLIDDRE